MIKYKKCSTLIHKNLEVFINFKMITSGLGIFYLTLKSTGKYKN